MAVDADEDGEIQEIIEIDDFEIEDIRSGIRIEVDEDDDIEVLHSSLDDLEESRVRGAFTTCPDCGCGINFENDGGNGFCMKCAHDH